ncbi:MAG: hypothetical protein ACYDG3_12400 [Bacillati bacterium]
MPHKNINKKASADDEAGVIVIREDSIYGFEHVIDKMMGREEPRITSMLRMKPFELGVYRIRDGRTKKLTHDGIEVTNSRPVGWMLLTNEEAKALLGTNNPPIFGTYIRDLRRYFGKHEMAYINHPVMFWHDFKPLPKPIQEKLF